MSHRCDTILDGCRTGATMDFKIIGVELGENKNTPV